MREAQEKAMQKQVDARKLTQQQADQRLELAQQFAGPTMIKVFGSVGVVVVNPVMLFFVALVVWLVGKLVCNGGFSYLKAMEVAGLAGAFDNLGRSWSCCRPGGGA